MLNVIFMKEIGRMIKLMDMVNICIWMELLIKVNGNLISNMVKELKLGQMVQYMKVNIKKVKKKA
jgi:hypothetical protein